MEMKFFLVVYFVTGMDTSLHSPSHLLQVNWGHFTVSPLHGMVWCGPARAPRDVMPAASPPPFRPNVTYTSSRTSLYLADYERNTKEKKRIVCTCVYKCTVLSCTCMTACRRQFKLWVSRSYFVVSAMWANCSDRRVFLLPVCIELHL